MFSKHQGRPSHSSLRSLSSAFLVTPSKRSPRIAATASEIQATTADSYEGLLLQPKQTSGLLHGVFTDHEKVGSKNGDETEGKVSSDTLTAAEPGATARDQELARILNQPYAKGNRRKAEEVLNLLESSEKRILLSPEPSSKGLGAINRDGVTCWLDSLLFAMFSHIENYKPMIVRKFPDEPRERLAMMLRLYVNLLRTGRLITTDITKQLQLAIADCGWKEAAQIHQQDASEAYSFITDQLELPMLTLKMDLFHSGKEDTDSDHKLIQERVIEVPVPVQPDGGPGITLEDCLETYFDNRVEVNRFQYRRNTMSSMRSGMSIEKGQSMHVEVTGFNDSQPSTPQGLRGAEAMSPLSPIRPAVDRQKMPSVITTSHDPEKADLVDVSSPVNRDDLAASRRRAGSLKKEVTMPAWQIFNLIPWNNPSDAQGQPPSSNAEVAALLSNRPIVPIALKRSQMENGRSVRRDTFIDVPLTYKMPHFVKDDSLQEDDPLHGHFMLKLQSFVCHQGTRPDSGHYISAARVASSEDDPGQWLLMDDLAKERVSYIDDIRKFLDKEKPYLLFYRVEPINADPPPYQEAVHRDSGVALRNVRQEGSGELMAEEAVTDSRHSLDFSLPEPRRGRSSMNSDRRQSLDHPNGDTDNYKSASAAFLTTGSERNGSSGSRRGSKVSRSSLSLSRLAGKLSKEKSSTSLTRPAANGPQRDNTSRPPTSDGPRTLDIGKDIGKSQYNHSSNGHRNGMLGKRSIEKGERECLLM